MDRVPVTVGVFGNVTVKKQGETVLDQLPAVRVVEPVG
jgi:hypothetical protein